MDEKESCAYPVLEQCGNETYTVLNLPAQPWELLDALDRVRFKTGDALYLDASDSDCCDFSVLCSCLKGARGSLLELNDLAQRLSRLKGVRRTAFEGLLQIDLQKKEPLSVKRLRDLAESADCCHVVSNVLNHSQLGRFYAENGFVPEVEGVPDAVFELLDFELIGRRAQSDEGGVFTRHGYVVQHTDLKEAPKISPQRPSDPDYTMYLRLLAHHDDLPFGGTDTIELKLPAGEEELEMAVKWMGYADWETVECTCLDCKVPGLAEHITSDVPFGTIDQVAKMLAQIPEDKLPVYKALIAATDCLDMETALMLADRLDEYILSPQITSPDDAAAEELALVLPDEAARLIRPHLNLYAYGQELLASRNNVQTEYGLLERRDGQPIRRIGEQSREQQMGGMTL